MELFFPRLHCQLVANLELCYIIYFMSSESKYRDVLHTNQFIKASSLMQVYPFGGANYSDSMHSDPSEMEDAQSSLNYSLKQGYGLCNFVICFISILAVAQ